MGDSVVTNMRSMVKVELCFLSHQPSINKIRCSAPITEYFCDAVGALLQIYMLPPESLVLIPSQVLCCARYVSILVE